MENASPFPADIPKIRLKNTISSTQQKQKALQHYQLNPSKQDTPYLLDPHPATFTILIRVDKAHRQSPFSLDVAPSDTIKHIKERLADELKTYSEDQTIRFNSKILEDPLPLSYYSIQPQSAIDVSSHGFHLTIHYFHSTPFDVKVQPYFTIAHVKQCITDIKSIPKRRQRLLFKGGEMNAPTKALYDYGVKWGAHIQLLLLNDPFKITVRFLSGMTSQLTVNAEDTVKDVKQMIAEKYDVRIEQQRLTCNGKKLKNSHALQYYNIPRGATLRLTVIQAGGCPWPARNCVVFIKHNNNKDDNIALKVTPSDSILQIKEKLADKIKTYPEHQMMEFDKKRLGDGDILLNCQNKHGYVLNVVSLSYKINVLLMRRELFCVVVRSNNTVRYVKCAIITCKGIQLNQHKLRYKGRELEDDATLYDCGIKAESTLELVFKRDSITIHLRTEGGDTCTLKVATNVTIEGVKKKMGLHPEKYLCLFESKLLSGDKSTLDDCGISNNAVIDVVPYELLYETLESQQTQNVQMEHNLELETDQKSECLSEDSETNIVIIQREKDGVKITDETPTSMMKTKMNYPPSMMQGDDAYIGWLVQLTQHLNEFDEIYKENGLELAAVSDVHDQIEDARASFLAITELMSYIPTPDTDSKPASLSPPPPGTDAYEFEEEIAKVTSSGYDTDSKKEATPTPTPTPSTSDPLQVKWLKFEEKEKIEKEEDISSAFEVFMDSIPYAEDARRTITQSKLRAEAKEFIYAPQKAHPVAVSPTSAVSLPPATPIQSKKWNLSIQQQPARSLRFVDCVMQIHSCTALGENITNFFHRYNSQSQHEMAMKNETVSMIQNKVNIIQSNEMTQSNSNDREIRIFTLELQNCETFREPWMVFVFGSESWKIRSMHSDIDIGIQLPFRTKREQRKMFLTQLIGAINNEKRNEFQYKSLLHAKYPIIRIQNRDKMQFDISIADEYCMETKDIIHDLMNEFEKIQVPVRPLVVFVKYWAKQRGILNGFKRYLNAFGYTILTINYLQFVTHSGSLSYRDNLCYWVYGFFFFYSNYFDVTKHCIRIMRNIRRYQTYAFYDKEETQSWLEIIDPANTRNNIARQVGYNEYCRIHEEFDRSYQICNCYSRDDVTTSSLFEKLTQLYIE